MTACYQSSYPILSSVIFIVLLQTSLWFSFFTFLLNNSFLSPAPLLWVCYFQDTIQTHSKQYGCINGILLVVNLLTCSIHYCRKGMFIVNEGIWCTLEGSEITTCIFCIFIAYWYTTFFLLFADIYTRTISGTCRPKHSRGWTTLNKCKYMAKWIGTCTNWWPRGRGVQIPLSVICNSVGQTSHHAESVHSAVIGTWCNVRCCILNGLRCLHNLDELIQEKVPIPEVQQSTELTGAFGLSIQALINLISYLLVKLMKVADYVTWGTCACMSSAILSNTTTLSEIYMLGLLE